MTIIEALELFNRRDRATDPYYREEQLRKIIRWQNIYYSVSLHTSGAAPAYYDLSYRNSLLPGTAPTSNAFAFETGAYGSYLSSLRGIGFYYDGYWIFPPNFQGWEYHFMFDKRILTRHPREDEDIRMFRFSQYEAITQAPCGQISEVVTGAIFQDNNYTVQIEDEEDNKYIWGNNFYGYDFVSWFVHIGYKNIVEDPNGFVLRIPKRPYYYYDANPSEPIDVELWFINSKDIIYCTEDLILFYKDGYGWYIDKQVIWRFKYNYETKEYEIAPEDAQGYYAHLLGKLPITKAGGVWNTHGYYDSYYQKAIPMMNDFIRSYSEAQIADKEASVPIMEEPDVDCPSCDGHGYRIETCDTCPGGSVNVPCTKCNHGKVNRYPGQHLVKTKEDYENGVGIKFITPDVSPNKHLREVCKDLMYMILEALHLAKTKSNSIQSAEAKAIDRDNLFKFVENISSNLFDKHFPDALQDIIAYRHAKSEGGQVSPDRKDNYIIVKPSQYQIQTAEDLLIQYRTASEANVPKFILKKKAIDYIDKQYSGDAIMMKRAIFHTDYNPLYVYSTDEKIQMKGIFTRTQYIVDQMLDLWLNDVIRTKGVEWFKEAEFEPIKVEIDKLRDQYLADNPEITEDPESDAIGENRTVTE